jgi:cysteine sulfinate desulfinase/cysteine desulfurase-like protein
LALNLKKEQINNTVRFGIGKFNTIEEINTVIDMFNKKFKGK